MTSLRPTRNPAFLWQAGLILLPVAIMAAVASRAIIQSRAEVERDARQRAEEIARQCSKELERRWGHLLSQQDYYSQRWSHCLEKVGAWPGGKRLRVMETQEAQWYPGQDLRAELAEWRAQHPRVQPEEVFPDTFDLMADGRWVRDGFGFPGLEYDPAPQPPAWFMALSPAQRAAWDDLKGAAESGASVDEIEQRIARFKETGPERAAELNAAFLGLRARWARLPPAEAVTEALNFLSPRHSDVYEDYDQSSADAAMAAVHLAQEYREVLSEAGLPLANLAFGDAVHYARAVEPSEELWDAIPDQVLRAPSLLIPPLLGELEAIAGTNTTLQIGVGAWRTLWNARLKLHDLAEAIRQSGKLRGITTTNLWIERNQTRWLCILNPDTTSALQAARGVTGSTNRAWTQVRFLPKPEVAQAVARGLEDSQVKLPDYLRLAVWLEGEPLSLPQRWSLPRGTNAAPAVLAEAVGGLSSPSKLQTGAGGLMTDWEDLPSRPRFVLQLCLADPALLLASYWRHAWLLAGLVAASVFAALIGVVTSWRAFQRQLRLNELKSNFVSSVSHELRSPIASVRLMAESLERDKVAEAPKQHEYFHFIVQECRRLSSLIENVLDFSRIEQGRKQYDFEPTDLVALTRQTVTLMDTYAAERAVTLQLQLPDSQPSTLIPQPSADGKALQQALVNLIDNALKHSPKGETVIVGLQLEWDQNIQHPTSDMQPQAARVLLWVEDHGGGIPASEQEKIFERFYRPGSELRRETQGVGIGLSIVKHIVEAHGGRVLVRSAPGQGSRFTIELPLNHSEDAKTPRE
jgi:signal transduction histidine kinase